jgi:voltage-gated potassium channel
MSIVGLPIVTTPPARAPAAEWLDRRLTRPMFYLSAAVLVLVAGVIHRLGHGALTDFEAAAIFWGLALLWPIFIVESLVRLVACRRPGISWRRRLTVFLGVCLFPPFRLGGRAYADPATIWLPGLGWTRVDRDLRTRLERFFCVPMICIALLVLPFLAMEYFWLETVRANFGLSLLLDIGTSIIWLAFALEVIVLVSVADKKAQYCLTNWLDLAVVFLPLVDFMPLLRLVRLAGVVELGQVSRLSRLYRLRGLLFKLWRTVLLLEIMQRLLGHYREKRLRRLKELLAARQEEIIALSKEIAELQDSVAAEKANVEYQI